MKLDVNVVERRFMILIPMNAVMIKLSLLAPARSLSAYSVEISINESQKMIIHGQKIDQQRQAETCFQFKN